jgi:hypothetical protein
MSTSSSALLNPYLQKQRDSSVNIMGYTKPIFGGKFPLTGTRNKLKISNAINELIFHSANRRKETPYFKHASP